MKRRFITRIAGLAALVAIVSLATSEVTGQAGSSTSSGGKRSSRAPRTPWGDPDLQGVWSYASLTPLERPTALAGKEFFTPEEAEAREAETKVDRPPRPGDVGTYNALWFDRGKVAADRRTSLIVDPPDGRLPLTDAARKQLAARGEYLREHPADSWLDRSPWDRCITYHGVPPVSTGYNNTYQIFQTPEYVAILVENIHDVRIIPLDRRPRLSDAIRQWNGDSRGRWEGETLVVETANFSEKTVHRFPSSKNTRAVERFRRVSDDLIDYQFTVTDETMYTRPWTVVRPMPRLTDYQIYEYACHEGNYAMSGILAGERVQEKAKAEAAKKTGSR